MSRTLTSIAALALLSGAALAADIPVYEPPADVPAAMAAYDWTGFYLGAFGGFGWGDYDFDYNPPNVGDDTEGWLAGGEIGAQMQWNSIVLGFETDIAGTGIDGSNSCPNPAFDCDTEINWLGTARGRLGVAFDRFHFFGTGGFAYADVTGETVFLPGGAIPPSGTPVNGEDNLLIGWTAGAGAEAQFANRWTVKADWLYYDLDEENFDIDNGLVVDVGHTGHVVRLHVTKLLP
jgi:outer membrane immunogenic protein